ncbi:hypothetical protein GLIP_3952 [Aliiglaciecola lipolytica E3]|uniref:Uncharacterized protein n=2 Tax=Aliiglaciecola TaxID=1406885 RepID=K6YIW9_9ALTE|nr:hypothetical protein GLIP_3952 [Aliiglaciecola lipolytica E3]
MRLRLLFTAKQTFYRYSLLMLSFTIAGCNINHVEGIDVDEVFSQYEPSLRDGQQLLLNDKWWLAFNDPILNELIELGLANNPSLSSSLLRLKSSQLNIDIANADFYPDLTLNSSATTDIEKPNKVTDSLIGLSSSWELDLWGRISALEEKAKWDYAARRALHQARVNALAGSITVTWFNLLAENEKGRIFAGQFSRTEQALKVIKQRFASGKNSITDIWQQARLLESIVAQQTQNNARAQLFKQQLSFLVGSHTLPDIELHPLPTFDSLPEMGISISMLQQRPDIQQAYAELRSANENLAASVSAMFPRLSLRASYNTRQNDTSELFDQWAGNLVASLAQPLFDSGVRRNRVNQQELILQASFADFRQAWLSAIQAVEERIINEERYFKIKELLTNQRELAEKTAQVVSIKYLHGKTTYLQLLRAQETNLSLERQLFDARLTLINNRVALFRELSHGQFNQTPQFIDLSKN